MELYPQAIEHAAQLSPSLDYPGDFIRWAEDIASLICFIYDRDYEDTTEDLFKAAKLAQDYEDSE